MFTFRYNTPIATHTSRLTLEDGSITDTEAELLKLIRDRCYMRGNFTLSSGDQSDYYFDGKMIEMFSSGARLIGQVIFDRTKDMKIDAIGGLEIGAIPLTTAAVYAYHLHNRSMEGFIVRHEAKAHGTRKIIEGVLRGGNKVVVVDDVVTKGTSVLKAIDAVRRAEAEPVMVLALMDRLQGTSEAVRKTGIPYQAIFTIKDFDEC